MEGESMNRVPGPSAKREGPKLAGKLRSPEGVPLDAKDIAFLEGHKKIGEEGQKKEPPKLN